ncbi:hypothetical protein V499_02666 [Pseudogymnoascus sp. VKM F-103]|nr:hypothetical protein V499_02666 [Pseudogymnoascus sp. VKM F-103]
MERYLTLDLMSHCESVTAGDTGLSSDLEVLAAALGAPARRVLIRAEEVGPSSGWKDGHLSAKYGFLPPDPLWPNSRRTRVTDARRSSPSNSGKEPFYQRHQDRGRSRERRSHEDNVEEAREARAAEARHHNAELRDNHRENYCRPYREYRGHGRGRGRGHFEGRW